MLFFSFSSELTGCKQDAFVLSDSADVFALKRAMDGRYPELKQLTNYRVAVNMEYAEDARQLKDGDEVAVIPPVSGG